MVRMACGVVLVSFVVGTAVAQDCGSTFSQSLAVLRDGKIQVVYQVTKPVYVTQTQTYTEFVEKAEAFQVNVNGKPETRTRLVKVPVQKERQITIQKTVCELRTRDLDQSAAVAYDAAGKPLDWAVLTKRLAKPTLVVVTTNGKPLPPKMAAVFKPETIVIAPPAEPPQPYHEAPVLEGAVPAILPVAPPAPAPQARPIPATEPPARNGARLLRQAKHAMQLVAFQTPLDEPTAQSAPQVSDISQLPATPSPVVQFASQDENGGICVTTINTFENTAYIELSESDDEGRKTFRKAPVIQRNETRMSTIYPIDTVAAVTVDGRKVPAEILTRFLKTERAVLVATPGAKVDPRWLQNMKPTTVILSVPQVQHAHGGAVAPATPMPAPVAVPARVVEPAARPSS